MCMTSRYEGFCIAVLEAMYFGACPVITNYGPNAVDVTDHQRIGCIVEDSTAQSAAEHLITMMEDEQLITKCIACQKYARSRFSYEVLARQLDSYLKRFAEKDT